MNIIDSYINSPPGLWNCYCFLLTENFCARLSLASALDAIEQHVATRHVAVAMQLQPWEAGGDASDLSEMQAKVRLIVFFARLASTRSRVNINSLEP